MPSGKDLWVRGCFVVLAACIVAGSVCTQLGYDADPEKSWLQLPLYGAPVALPALYLLYWGSLRRSGLLVPVAGGVLLFCVATWYRPLGGGWHQAYTWAPAVASAAYLVHFLRKRPKRRAGWLKLIWLAGYFNGLVWMDVVWASPLVPFGTWTTALLYITLLDVRLDQRREEERAAQPRWDFDQPGALPPQKSGVPGTAHRLPD